MVDDTAVICSNVSDKHNVFKTAQWCTLRSKESGPLLEEVGLPPGIWQFWRGLALTVDKLSEHGYGQSNPWVPAQD